MLNGWKPVRRYLDEKRIPVPAALTYQMVCDYVPWRMAQLGHSGAPIHRNTALFDVKVLGVVMREAVRRSFAQGNPCHRTGLKRLPPKQKSEMTDAEIATIRAELARRECHLPVTGRWMTVSFEVALHHGCRLSETAVPMEGVDPVAGTIRFSAKGRGGRWPKGVYDAAVSGAGAADPPVAGGGGEPSVRAAADGLQGLVAVFPSAEDVSPVFPLHSCHRHYPARPGRDANPAGDAVRGSRVGRRPSDLSVPAGAGSRGCGSGVGVDCPAGAGCGGGR